MNLLEITGDLASIPEHLQHYFDYDAYTRDLFMDYTSVDVQRRRYDLCTVLRSKINEHADK